jgi:phospholipid/cholesterol/gamma-HCH transport system ATP-binding protein
MAEPLRGGGREGGEGSPAQERATGVPVRVRGLALEYGSAKVLSGVQLDAAPGEITAVMGVSGSGKTSLLKCMAGLARPTAGEIWIGEVNIASMRETDLNVERRRVGMVFQYAALFDSMTVYDNVAFGLRHQRRLPEARIRARVTELLASVGLEGTERMMPAQLSGGMRKRVGLARALATDPQVLFYDEPTSGLDPIVAGIIDSLIVRVRDSFGVTSVVVSHDIASILRTCDRVAMLHEGRIVASGTAGEIRESGDPYVRQFLDGNPEGPIGVAG